MDLYLLGNLLVW